MPIDEEITDARITSVTKETLVEDGSQFLDVTFDILEMGEVIATRKLGFPLDTPEEEVVAEVKRTAQGFKADIALLESRKEQEKVDENSEIIIESLTNKEI